MAEETGPRHRAREQVGRVAELELVRMLFATVPGGWRSTVPVIYARVKVNFRYQYPRLYKTRNILQLRAFSRLVQVP